MRSPFDVWQAELVRWFIEATTPAFDEMSRRDQRNFLREHWLGQSHRAFEQGFLLPTGLIIGLPIVLSFAITLLTLHRQPALRILNWMLTILAVVAFTTWIIAIFGSDAGVLPSVSSIDYVMFPVATVITLYLTWRLFGGFIVAFCLFWVIYFFLKGYLPDWTGILAGSEATFGQNLRQMILQFWSQTGGMFGQPIQVVAGNVLIFIVFGAVLMASGAGELLMKIANRLTGGVTGGAAHASVASSALFGTLSGAALSNVVSTGVMTIPVIRKAGFKPAFAAAVEAAASTGGQIMPPVMGVVAFFVAGQIGLEYRYIVVAAILRRTGQRTTATGFGRGSTWIDRTWHGSATRGHLFYYRDCLVIRHRCRRNCATKLAHVRRDLCHDVDGYAACGARSLRCRTDCRCGSYQDWLRGRQDCDSRLFDTVRFCLPSGGALQASSHIRMVRRGAGSVSRHDRYFHCHLV